MKKSSKRLQTVLKLAQLKQQQAAEQLGALTRNALAQQQQEQQLKHYQLDYNQHFKALQGGESDANLLRNFQGFYQQLEQVIETQGQRVHLAQDQLDAARSHWQKQYAREKNLERLVDRRVFLETLEQDKKAQREQDDRQRPKPL